MRISLEDTRCPFCGASSESRGRHYRRCPDVECAGHHWSAERKWNKRAISNLERALQDVLEARDIWARSGDPAALSITLWRLKELICPGPEKLIAPPELEIIDEPVPIYGCVIAETERPRIKSVGGKKVKHDANR